MSRAALAAVAALATAGAVAGLFGTMLPARAATVGALTKVSWSAGSTQAGATSSYTYTFDTVTGSNLTSVQMTLPTGTTGTPALGTVSTWDSGSHRITLSSQSVSRSGTILTFAFTSPSNYINPNSTMSVQVTGLTNTTTAGSYPATITTYNGTTQVDTGTTNAVAITAATLGATAVQPSSLEAGATGTSYTYRFTTTTTASLSTVTMTVPPGTAGTASLGSVSPAALGDGSLTQSGSVLSYTFAATSVPAGTPVSIQVTGLTNTTDTVLGYASEIATQAGSTWVDGASTDPLSFTAHTVSGPSWSASALTTGASGVGYTYGFTTHTAQYVTAIEMSVPPGTTGTPAVGTVSMNAGYAIVPTGTTGVSLSGTTLTFTMGSTYLQANTVVSIQITGLTNTTTAGSYQASIVTVTTDSAVNAPPAIDSGVTPAVTFTSTSLSAVSWKVSSTATGVAAVTYTLSFQLPATSTLSAFSMSLPPGSGTSAALTSVTPSSIAGGTIAVASNTVTYTLPSPKSVSSASTITLAYTISNTTTPSVWASTVTAMNGSTTLATGSTGQVTFTSTALTALSWSATSTAAGASGVTYTFGFTTSSGATITSVTMSVPAGTAGTPALGTVTIYSPSQAAQTPSAQSISLAQNTLTYSVTLPDYLNPGSTFTIQVTGLTNTAAPGSYASAITTKSASKAIDSGTTPTLSFSSSSLGSPTWSTSSNGVKATGVTYTYGFVPSASLTVDTITMTVPSGTAGTPTIGAVSPAGLATGATVSLSGGLLTYTLPAATTISGGASVSIAIGGITNTSSAGIYPSAITASWQGTAVAAGTTSGVSFAATVLSALSWTVSATHTGTTGVTYTYEFTTGSATTIGAVTMTVPPGTGPQGALGVGTVSGIGAGTASLDQTSGTITYTVTSPAWIAGGTAISIAITGVTNGGSPGAFSSTIATRTGSAGGTVLESGSTPAVTMVGGALVGPTWSASSLFTTAPADNTYRFSTVSTSALTAVSMTVPSGTTGTPAVGAVTGLPTGGTIGLSGSTLTYTFTATTVAANTAVTLRVTGLSNTLADGTYTSYMTTQNSAEVIDQGTTSPAVTLLQDRALTFTNDCPVDPGGCSIGPGGTTEVTLIAIPGASAPSTASVVLGVQTNARAGYLISALLPVLSDANGDVLGQAPTTGTDTPAADQFFASASLTGSATSGAALCSPYGSVTPFVGYSSIGQSVWHAAAATDNGTDMVTIVNGVRVSATQPAGTYTGTISYHVTPAYSGTAPTC